MSLLRNVIKGLEELLSSPVHVLGRWAKVLWYALHTAKFCVRRLNQYNAAAMSAALSYQTIFALIPLLVLTSLVLKSSGTLEEGRQNIHKVLDAYGLTQINIPAQAATSKPSPTTSTPTSQPTVNLADKIESLVAEIEGKLTFATIGPVGLIVLAWATIILLMTLEDSLNRIFEAPRSRSLLRRILLYWAVITLIPIAIVGADWIFRLAGNAADSMPWIKGIIAFAGSAGKFVISVILLAAVYKSMPNTKIPMKSAIGGAIVTIPIWLITKWGFLAYVQQFVAPGNIYGAIGLVPLFLFWIYICWWIFLFGAEISHTANNVGRFAASELADKIFLGPSHMLATAMAVIEPYTEGRGTVTRSQISRLLTLPEECVQRMLDRLCEAGILCPVNSADDPTTSGGFIPAIPPDKISIGEIFALAGLDKDAKQPQITNAKIAGVVAAAAEMSVLAVKGLTVSDMLKKVPGAGEKS